MQMLDLLLFRKPLNTVSPNIFSAAVKLFLKAKVGRFIELRAHTHKQQGDNIVLSLPSYTPSYQMSTDIYIYASHTNLVP